MGLRNFIRNLIPARSSRPRTRDYTRSRRVTSDTELSYPGPSARDMINQLELRIRQNRANYYEQLSQIRRGGLISQGDYQQYAEHLGRQIQHQDMQMRNLITHLEVMDRNNVPMDETMTARLHALGFTEQETPEAEVPNYDPETGLIAVQEKKKRRTRRTDAAVAEAIADYTDEKVKKLGEKVKKQKEEEDIKERQLRESRQKLLTLKRSRESLEEKYAKLNQKQRSELVENYRKVITQLKTHPRVKGFRVDSEKRVIVTTTPIKIKKDHWPEEREAGIYEIRVDFSKTNISEAIQILNITQRYSDYDSPTISNTHPCWGNIQEDIEQDLSAQDLYELVIDLIDYISSPNDDHGYLEWEEDHDSEHKYGWEQFFKKPTPQPKNFSFEKYDQQNRSRHISGAVTVGGTIGFDPGTVTAYDNRVLQYIDNAALGTSAQMYAPPLREPYEAAVNRALQEMGFTEAGAYHFSNLLVQSRSRNIEQIDLVIRHGEIQMFVRRTDDRPVTAEMRAQDTAPVMDERIQVERYFVNDAELRPAELERLRRTGSVRNVVRTTERYMRMEELEQQRRELAQQAQSFRNGIAGGYASQSGNVSGRAQSYTRIENMIGSRW